MYSCVTLTSRLVPAWGSQPSALSPPSAPRSFDSIMTTAVDSYCGVAIAT
jgi:hypothetical protein